MNFFFIYLLFFLIFSDQIFATVFVIADLNKSGSFQIIQTPNAQPDNTSLTPDKNDETKQTRNRVNSPSMDQNGSKQKTQEYSRLVKTTEAINLSSEKLTSTDQLSLCTATTNVWLTSENQNEEGKLKQIYCLMFYSCLVKEN